MRQRYGPNRSIIREAAFAATTTQSPLSSIVLLLIVISSAIITAPSIILSVIPLTAARATPAAFPVLLRNKGSGGCVRNLVHSSRPRIETIPCLAFFGKKDQDKKKARHGMAPIRPLSSDSTSCQTGTTSIGSSSNNNDSGNDAIRTDFASHLSSVTSTLQSQSPSQLQSQSQQTSYNLIIGNEAGDADSIISALALSYVTTTTTTTTSTAMTVPVVSIPRADMALRRDTSLLLSMAGIDIHRHLLYMDDYPISSLLDKQQFEPFPNPNLTLTLVDHNRLRSKFWHLHNQVTEIVDHHKDERQHLFVQDDDRNIAFRGTEALVGSTCTLVTERLMKVDSFGRSGSGKGGGNVDPGVALALLGTMLLDTMNMNPEAGKGTERDGRAIDFLMEETDWDDCDGSSCKLSLDKLKEEQGIPVDRLFTVDHRDHDQNDDGGGGGETGGIITATTTTRRRPDREALYQYLLNSKFDLKFWEGMSVNDVLRIDFKRFEASPLINRKDDDDSSEGIPKDMEEEHGFGLSSVLLSLPSLLSRDGFIADAIDYMEEVDVDLLGIMSMVLVDGTPHRELLLIGFDKDRVEGMTQYLLNDESAAFLDISLNEDEDGEDGCGDDDLITIRKFRQGNPKGSRKQLSPVMLQFYSSLSSRKD